jgi:hypothetical protein
MLQYLRIKAHPLYVAVSEIIGSGTRQGSGLDYVLDDANIKPR